MHKHSSLALLELACSNSLLWLDLEVPPEINLQDLQLASAKLVSMKKLAGLQLAGLSIAPQTLSIQNLRSLQELTLLKCKMTPLVLLRGTTLSLLRRLHMEDELFEWAADRISKGTLNLNIALVKEVITKLGSSILSLPRLRHISGDSSIMEMGMTGLLVKAPSIKAYTSRSNGSQRCIKASCLNQVTQYSTNQ